MPHFSVKFRLLLFIAAALAVLCLSVMPNPPVPQSGVLSWDKLQHALAYGCLVVLGGWALLPLVPSKLRAWRYALIIVVGYGALMEVLQALLFTGRSGDPFDMLANALGGLAIYIPVRLLYCRMADNKEDQR